MKIKIYTTNENNKIEISKEELEELINSSYKDGFKDGEEEGFKNGQMLLGWKDGQKIELPYYPTWIDKDNIKITL